jgi:hypothetical protein
MRLLRTRRHAPHYRALLGQVMIWLLMCGAALANNAPGPPYGGPADTLTVKPTGGTASVPMADWDAQTVSVISHGAKLDGVSDDAPALLASMQDACSFMPVKAVIIPHGILDMAENVTVPPGCNSLVLGGPRRGWTLRVDPANTSNPAILSANGQKELRIYGAVLDGSANSTNVNALANLTAPMPGVRCEDCVVKGGAKSFAGFALYGSTGVTATLAASDQLASQGLVNLASTPGTLHAGAYLVSNNDIPDIFISSIAGNTLTMNRNLTDTWNANSVVRFTYAFSLTARAIPGQVALAVDNTNGLAAGDAVWDGAGDFAPGTTVTAFDPIGLTVTLSQGPLNFLVSGANVAAAAGFDKFTLSNVRVENFGQGFFTSATQAFTLASAAATGDTSLVLNCASALCATAVGPLPGHTTSNTVQGGLPAGVVIVSQAINAPAGTVTLGLDPAHPVTAPIASGTSLSFLVGASTSNGGFGVWSPYGAAFASSFVSTNSVYRHTWGSSLFLGAFGRVDLMNNKFEQTLYNEFQGTANAASACAYVFASLNYNNINNDCDGATGAGWETDHVGSYLLSGGHSNSNGGLGSFTCGGRNVTITGGRERNNGQSAIQPVMVQVPTNYGNVSVNHSCSYTKAGTLDGLTVSNMDLGNDQAIPNSVSLHWWGNPAGTLATPNATITNIHIDTKTINVAGALSGIDVSLVPSNSNLLPSVENRLQNPCFAIDQRNEGGAITTSGYGPDRWKFTSSPGAKMSLQRGAGRDGACANYENITVSAQYTPVTTNFQVLFQGIEAQNLYDLQWGVGTATSVVLDITTRSSVAFTTSLYLQASGYSYVQPITIPASLSSQSFVMPGLTAAAISGIATNSGLTVGLNLGSGPSELAGACGSWTAGNFYGCSTDAAFVSQAVGSTLQVTGMRLFAGATDTSWVQRPLGQELGLVQRYFRKTFPAGVAPVQSAGLPGALCHNAPSAASYVDWMWDLTSLPMRAAPTVTTYNPSAANANARDVTAGADVPAAVDSASLSANSVHVSSTAATGAANDNVCLHMAATADF